MKNKMYRTFQIAISCFIIFLIIFAIYFILLPDIKCLLQNPPDGTLPISITGAFGDSFGALTCFFSGLSFIGIIITLFIQQKQFDHNTEINEVNAKLSACSFLNKEYSRVIQLNQVVIEKILNLPEEVRSFAILNMYYEEIECLTKRRNDILIEIEKISENYGFKIEPLNKNK